MKVGTDAPLGRICLCVIARDEADRIGPLLERHAALWDEAVVVDTGSVDDTAAVARRHGARVACVPWQDDFGAARNASLDLARGDWALVLDCDEMIAADDFAAVRALTGRGSAAWSLVQRNYADDSGLPDWRPVGAGDGGFAGGAAGYVPVHSIRLFPLGRGVRYAGRIHETVEDSLATNGIIMRNSDVAVHHVGHRDTARRQRLRLERDGRLLRRAIREKPDDPALRRQLAVQLVREGQGELAVALLRRTVAEAPGGPQVDRARRLLARLLAGQGRLAEALAQAEAALCERPDLADAWLDAVRLSERAGDRDRAGRLLGAGRRLFPAESRLAALEAQVLGGLADNQ